MPGTIKDDPVSERLVYVSERHTLVVQSHKTEIRSRIAVRISDLIKPDPFFEESHLPNALVYMRDHFRIHPAP